ncbi:MAG TPA: YfhO family protein [Vicinamibacteria bacterium]|nr:YfhO family protein [Vicinamibacteria bacterium]
MRPGASDLGLAALLAALPALAYAPALWGSRLLAPGDGFALHFPLKAAVWEAYRRGELPGWNPGIFLGTPLLASYRPGAFHPLVAALFPLPPFEAFQLLVLLSLGAAAALTYAYVRRLGGHPVGAFFAGLSFALGPYLVSHLGDTAAVVAAPALPLVLLAAEALLFRPSPSRIAGLAAAVALLLLAGSPEAARAGLALVAGRFLVAGLDARAPRRPRLRAGALAVTMGALLAAPQLVPAMLAAREAGRPLTGLATDRAVWLPGATGLVLRYVSHTPAVALALAALPLALSQAPVLVLGAGLVVSLALQWGRSPLAAPGAAPLAFDFMLCALAGLSLSAQWRHRREPLGRRLRAWLLFFTLASSAALSFAAAALGPLPEVLAGAVGVLALALVLYFSQAAAPGRAKAGVFLLPLTASFLLQPHGRRVWEGTPLRQEIARGTGTREAIERAMGPRRSERSLALVTTWPHEQLADLAYGSLAALAGRRSANGYDPLVPLRTRAALGGMGVGGALPAAFLRTDPARLEMLGIRWVEVPSSALRAGPPAGPSDLALEVAPGRHRFFPLPVQPATEVRLFSWLAEAAERVPPDAVVATVSARLASGRAFELPLRGGATGAGRAQRAWLRLPGRYYVDAVRLDRLPGPGRLMVSRLELFDVLTQRVTPVSAAAAYVSDGSRLREVAATPALRLFELPGTQAARVVGKLRVMPTEDAVGRALGLLPQIGLDPRREALVSAEESRGLTLPRDARASRADLARSEPGRLDVRAEGPGLLVVVEAWDPGWRAQLDGRPAPVHRVNLAQMGVVLGEGVHHVRLSYHPRGLGPGLALFVAAGLALVLSRVAPPALSGRRGRVRVPLSRASGGPE